MTILDEILENKRAELVASRATWPLPDVQRAAEAQTPARGFRAALTQPGLAVIAEVKRQSPSAGVIRGDADPASTAGTYATAGASAISVLTDLRYFKGTNADLQAVHDEVGIPVLRKDFTVDDYNVWEARAIGADAVLLIVRALQQPDLIRLLKLTEELGMDALVEVHEEAEIRRAVDAGAGIIGINNRDLSSMTTTLETTVRLRPLIPAGVTVISESGIRTAADLTPLMDVGIDAVLVGEALMAASNPAQALQSLLQAGKL